MKATLKGKYGRDKASASATLSVAPAGDLRLKASVTDITFLSGGSLDGLSFSVQKPGSIILDFNVPKRDVRFQFMNSVRLAEKLVSLTYTHAWRENQTALNCSVEFDPANKLAGNYALSTGSCKVKYVYAHGEMPRQTVLEPSYDLSKNAWDFAVSRKFEGGDSLMATFQTPTKILGLEWNRDSKINGSFKVFLNVSKSFGVASYDGTSVPPSRMVEVDKSYREHCFGITKEWTWKFSVKPVSAVWFNNSASRRHNPVLLTPQSSVSASLNLAEQKKIPKLMAESTWDFEI